jgi:hypothetical protein
MAHLVATLTVPVAARSPKDVTTSPDGLRQDGTLVYATVQNSGRPDQVGGNYAALQFSNDPSSAFFGCYKNRRTDKRVGGLIVAAGDDLCEIQANGWDGTTYNTSGSLDFTVDSPPARGALPTSFAVWLGSTSGSGISANRLALLLDSHTNAYFRNGHVGIGPAFGFDPPALYDQTRAPPFALTIGTPDPGTAFAAFRTGTQTGGARINVGQPHHNETSLASERANDPVYAFWGDSGTGIDNPDNGVITITSARRNVVRIDHNGEMAVAGPLDTQAIHLRPSSFQALPTCDQPHAGTMAYINDAPYRSRPGANPCGKEGADTMHSCPAMARNGTPWMDDPLQDSPPPCPSAPFPVIRPIHYQV